MTAIYNEINPFAASWLRNLIAAGHIAPGEVDERSIEDLKPADVAGPGQRHFFAGIGGWSYALRLAGVPDDADVWTGSCPCQPFSAAGKRGGTLDARHLWPAWFALIEQCRPATIFGEQVASRDGLAWFDIVRADLERCGYAVGASDLCAAGVGAPHIRQRLYFVAYTDDERRDGRRKPEAHRRSAIKAARQGDVVRVGNAGSDGGREHARELSSHEGKREVRATNGNHASINPGSARELADADEYEAVDDRNAGVMGREIRESKISTPGGSLEARNPWEPCNWIPCIDGVSRPVEPGTFPLAHRASARMGRLRGYGNAIVPQVAAAFIEAAETARQVNAAGKGGGG